MVDGAAIIKYKKHRLLDYAGWSDEELRESVARLLRAKAERRPKLKGGPYGQYVVLLYTDEPMLPFSQAEEWLNGMRFTGLRNIDRACLLVSYHPQFGYCPYLELAIDA